MTSSRGGAKRDDLGRVSVNGSLNMPASTEPEPREEDPPPDDKSDVLPARVYWVVAGLALAMMAFLYWLTASFNVPLGPP